jgi:hypothetical protein
MAPVFRVYYSEDPVLKKEKTFNLVAIEEMRAIIQKYKNIDFNFA